MAIFALYVWDKGNTKIPAAMFKATQEDLAVTIAEPRWQTDWTSDYITDSGFDLYALKTKENELVALGAYEVRDGNMGVHIVYIESQAQSNPSLTEERKYHGVGRALVAFGIKLSVDAGFNGDVTLDAKTEQLARHYEKDFGAVRLPSRDGGAAPRYLICDEAASEIFTDYLEEV